MTNKKLDNKKMKINELIKQSEIIKERFLSVHKIDDRGRLTILGKRAESDLLDKIVLDWCISYGDASYRKTSHSGYCLRHLIDRSAGKIAAALAEGMNVRPLIVCGAKMKTHGTKNGVFLIAENYN